jgi:hypothetical protein
MKKVTRIFNLLIWGMKREGYEVRTGVMRNSYKLLSENPKGERPLAALPVGGRII